MSLIQLTRLNSQQITVNSDIIKFIESNPDTVITLLNGDKILVQETAPEVVALIVEFRRSVIIGLLSIADPSTALAAGGNAQWEQNILPNPEGKSRG